MKKIWIAIFTLAGCMSADTLELRDGRIIRGTLVSATARNIRFTPERGTTTTYPISDVANVRFTDDMATGTVNTERSGIDRSTTDRSTTGPVSRTERSDRYERDRNSSNSRADSRPLDSSRASSSSRTVPEGTVVTVRTIDAINSDKNNAGDTFRASLDEPVIVNGRTVASQGSDVLLRIARVQQSGRVSGSEEVAVELAEVNIDGRPYRVSSNYAEVAAKSRGNQSAKVIGGTAVVGAIIGAIAGGGKGAAIGAASGAGAGAAVQAIRGQRVQIPSETKLDFVLSQPLSFE